MTGSRPAAGGGRWVSVGPERLAGWLERYAGRHGGLTWTRNADAVVGAAADGSVLEIEVPFPPLGDGTLPGALVQHALTPRRVGVLLVRLGGWAAGIFDGDRLVTSKVDSRQVQGRTAAGGWSQQRFARRRGNQRSASYDSAAGTAAKVLLPVASSLSGLAVGGDRRGIADVLADPRLAPLGDLPTRSFPDVPEPRRAVLDDVAARALSVEITVTNTGDRETAVPHGPEQNGATP